MRDAPKKIALSKRAVEALPLPASGRTYTYDSKTPGLAVCVTSAGSRSWYLYRKLRGRPVRIRIGSWPDMTVEAARKAAAKHLGVIASGGDPLADKVNRHAPTLGDAFEEFLEAPTRGRAKRARAASTTEGYRWQFKTHLAAWEKRRLATITRGDIEALHNELGRTNGTYLANRVFSLLRAVLNFAVEREYIPVNPAARVRPFAEKSRERFLQQDELPKFFAAVEAEPNRTLRDYFLLLLFTGARKSNLAAMRWSEVDLERRVWTIARTKSGDEVTLPLSGPAVELLTERQRLAEPDAEFVFPGRRSQGKTLHLSSPKTAWARVVKRAGLEGLRLHDLRRSLGSWMAAGGASLPIIGKGLGHRSTQSTQVYARLTLDPVRLAVEAATAAMLAAAAAGQEGNANEA